MRLDSLDPLLTPRRVGLIGAADTPFAARLGAAFAARLAAPQHGPEIAQASSAQALPWTPDLAVVALGAAAAPGAVAALAQAGCRAMVVAAAGMDGAARDAMRAAVRASGARLLGPDSVGLQVPAAGLDASACHRSAAPGPLALLTQSGAVMGAMLDWAAGRGVGFSMAVGLGDMLDVDAAEMLDVAAADPATKAVLLYLERVPDARGFLSAARAAARVKPVIVVKGGVAGPAADAAAAHAGAPDAPRGADVVYDAAFRRAGLLRVADLEEMFDAAEALARLRPARGDRLAVVSAAGGAAVLAADAVLRGGGRLARLAPQTRAALDALRPPDWRAAPVGDVVDLLDDADEGRWREALRLALADPGADAVLALTAPSGLSDPMAMARAAIAADAAQPGPRFQSKPVIAGLLGAAAVDDAAAALAAAGKPVYRSPGQAAEAFGYLAHYGRAQAALSRTPPGLPETAPDRAAAAALVDGALAQRRDALTAAEAARLLALYGLPAPDAAADRAAGQALLLAVAEDPAFGPVMVFGRGGPSVAVVADKALELPPLTMTLARDMIARTGIGRLLDGEGADVDAVAVALVRLAQMAADLPQIRGVTLEARSDGGVGAAEVALAPAARSPPGANPRFAIRPYPTAWDQVEDVKGRALRLRPLRAEDEALYPDFLAAVEPADMRLRFFSAIAKPSHAQLARLTQLDYARAMAFAAVDPETGALLGVSRLAVEADGETAEYAVLVRSDLKGAGVGAALMRRLIAYARAEGLRALVGEVMEGNGPMLGLCAHLGFVERAHPDDPALRLVRLALTR